MEKVNEIIKRVLADQKLVSPVSAPLAELTQLADSVHGKNRSPEDPEGNQEIGLRSGIQNLQNMQRSQMNMTEAEQLRRYVADQEKQMSCFRRMPTCLSI